MTERQPVDVLLEFELPTISGSDVLAELNDHPELAGTPAIVLTHSDEADVVATCYELHANAHVQKPGDPDEFADVVRSLENFWLQFIWLPDAGEDETDRR
ncbi:response regulator [Halosolutus amylolyticus]|uniref:Response regulator n=1 Tax=Halosolutus amylolyticus TaxID=2932267 RepID=A0ABD5PNQ7_9EURY|nr:response regulator [Halosolutus amylolyticus]